MHKLAASIILLALSLAPAKAQDQHMFEVGKNLEIFNSLYRELDMFYVDTLNADKLITVGIDAMLDYLDPYTEYYKEEDFGDLKMMTTGKYGGIGSLIRLRKDSTVIIAEPYEGMPAAEVGLKIGDVLLSIDGTDLKGKNTSEVSDMLRGEPGTTFVLRIQRPGEKKTRDFSITRRSIKLPAIPYYGMRGKTGYISLTQFTEDCSKDFRKAVISLKQQGATSLVIDLRNNGGGLLGEAVNIVNLFVPKGLKIVETKGKVRNANSIYKTTAEPLDTLLPIAVLVNGNTASAAEILSGSLQDLDRAVVIGAKTFGKGLVQSPRELPYNASIKFTTSKYYIPSGRCIQAIDYKKAREKEEAAAKGNKGAAKKDDAKADSLSHIFHTSIGRVVKDGGGIMPDITIKHDTLSNLLFYLSNDDVLIDFGTHYCKDHATIPAVEDFAISEKDFEDFKKMIKESDFKYDRMSVKRFEDLKKMAQFEGYYDEAKDEFEALEKKLEHNLDRDLDKNKKEIKRIMAHEIIKRYYFQAGSIQESLKDDEDFAKAQELLSNPDEIKKLLSK